MRTLIALLVLLSLAGSAGAQVREGTEFRLVTSNKSMKACTDPTSGGGLAAVTGSICLGTAGIYRKFSTGDTDWILIATGLTIGSGNSGGVPYYSSTTTLGSSATLTANLPIVGGGSGNPPVSGTRTGSTTEFASWTGAKTSGACVEIDASGNLYAEAAGCGVAGLTTIPFVYNFVVALCQSSTATLGLSLPSASAATPICITGTNTQFAAAEFPNSGTAAMQGHFSLPSDWTGNIDVAGTWRTSATTGSVVWQVSTICVADAETVDPAFNTASTTTDAAKGTTLQSNDFSLSSVTITGCAAGEELFFRFFRDSTHGSDDLAATAQLMALRFTIRRSV